jgi:hypothetical protein
LVGYSAEDQELGLDDAEQRRLTLSDGGSKPSEAGATPAADAVVAKPSDAGSSADTGAQGDAAAVAKPIKGCGLLQSCTPTCETGSCLVPCANSELCWTTCEEDTSCAIDCSNGGICDMNCHEGATCKVDCRNTRDCDHLECEEGASCVLYCGNNPLGCSLSCDDGVAMTCPNNVHTCDAPCPLP